MSRKYHPMSPYLSYVHKQIQHQLLHEAQQASNASLDRFAQVQVSKGSIGRSSFPNGIYKTEGSEEQDECVCSVQHS